jgi:hypothetical protein
LALRVGTIQKAFRGVEAKYGSGRIFGRFAEPVLTEPRATAAFLHVTLEQGGTDFGPFFGHPVNGTPGYDSTRYAPDAKITQVWNELALAWTEAKANAPFDPTLSLSNFVNSQWEHEAAFPSRFSTNVAKLQKAPSLRAQTLRFFQPATVPVAERPRVGGPRGLKLFRGLMMNAAKLKEEGGVQNALRRLSREYLQKKGLDPALADKQFPKFAGMEKAAFAPEQFARFLEARLSQDFAEVTPNGASYFLRDLARKGGGQLLSGSEFAYFADRDTTIFLSRSGLQGDVAPKVNLTTLDERALREVHGKAFELLQTEFIQTPAELSERMAIAARERLV